jgi:hypothetical protein
LIVDIAVLRDKMSRWFVISLFPNSWERHKTLCVIRCHVNRCQVTCHVNLLQARCDINRCQVSYLVTRCHMGAMLTRCQFNRCQLGAFRTVVM